MVRRERWIADQEEVTYYVLKLYRTNSKPSMTVLESMECRERTQSGMWHTTFWNSTLLLSNVGVLYPMGIYRSISKGSMSVLESMKCREMTQSGMWHTRFWNNTLVLSNRGALYARGIYRTNSKPSMWFLESMEWRIETHSVMCHTRFLNSTLVISNLGASIVLFQNLVCQFLRAWSVWKRVTLQCDILGFQIVC